MALDSRHPDFSAVVTEDGLEHLLPCGRCGLEYVWERELYRQVEIISRVTFPIHYLLVFENYHQACNVSRQVADRLTSLGRRVTFKLHGPELTVGKATFQCIVKPMSDYARGRMWEKILVFMD